MMNLVARRCYVGAERIAGFRFERISKFKGPGFRRMDQESLQWIMATLAIATPITGATLWAIGRSTARAAEEPLHPSIRRAAIILIVAGPLNLLVWLLFNDWLDAIGYRSAVGYGLAAAVFFGLGWSSGKFRKRRPPRRAAVAADADQREAAAPHSQEHHE